MLINLHSHTVALHSANTRINTRWERLFDLEILKKQLVLLQTEPGLTQIRDFVETLFDAPKNHVETLKALTKNLYPELTMRNGDIEVTPLEWFAA